MKLLAHFGDYHHASALYHRALKKALEGEEAEIEAVHYATRFDQNKLQDADTLVLCQEGCLPGGPPYDRRWMTRADEEAIVAWVEAGKRLFVWHSGLAGYEPDGPLHALFGGRFNGHPPIHRFKIEVIRPDDPFAVGIDNFEIADEHYTIVPSRELDPLLEGESSENGRQPICWRHAAGKGEVGALSVAHTLENLMLPPVQTLIRRLATGQA